MPTDLLRTLQSGFQPGHSTETAVLRVLSDIMLAADCGDASALVLLEMTAAFDTISHSILLQQLQILISATLPIDGFSHTCPVVNSMLSVVPLGHLPPIWSVACLRDLC